MPRSTPSEDPGRTVYHELQQRRLIAEQTPPAIGIPAEYVGASSEHKLGESVTIAPVERDDAASVQQLYLAGLQEDLLAIQRIGHRNSQLAWIHDANARRVVDNRRVDEDRAGDDDSRWVPVNWVDRIRVAISGLGPMNLVSGTTRCWVLIFISRCKGVISWA